MTTRVFGQAGIVNNIIINDVVDVLGPWRGVKTERVLTAGEFSGLVSAMEQQRRPALSGAPLRSAVERFLLGRVRPVESGKFTATAFHHPTDGFRSVSFDKPLFALDNSACRSTSRARLSLRLSGVTQTRFGGLRITSQGIEY